VQSIRADLGDLRRRIDELETRLETRIAAAEAKQLADFEALTKQWKDITLAVAAASRQVSNLADQQRASHYALVHLLAVTARQVRVPDADLNEAMRIAKEAIPP
jgi:phage host-nuclease inhibitor protein Gam